MNRLKKTLSLFVALVMILSVFSLLSVTANAEAPSGNYITFSSPEPFTIDALKTWNNIIQYSTDGETWDSYVGNTTFDEVPINAAQIGSTGDYYLCFRGIGNSYITTANDGIFGYWNIEGNSVSCSGNIETLLDYATVANGEHPEMNDSCFAGMFERCNALISAPELPATDLKAYCYSGMFAGCTNLTAAPRLPAIVISEGCYSSMFQDCTSLTAAPELPATAMAENCYSFMFAGCTNLAFAPELPATSLADRCYSAMFSGCTSLIVAPKLPATTMADGCYRFMFEDCTKLTTTPMLRATTLAQACYYSMFSGCTALTALPVLRATTMTYMCYDRMFENCTGIKLYTNPSEIESPYIEWSIPAGTNTDGAAYWNYYMFNATGGGFTGDPEVGVTYYYPNAELLPKDFDVTVTYQAGTAAETVYSVELTWGAMEFTYTGASQGVWNPTTLQFEGQETPSWTCEADANKITVKNRSNAGLNVSFALTPEEGIAGGFYDASSGGNEIVGNSFTLASAEPVGEETVGKEAVGTAYVHITSGSLTSGQTDVKIGQVTVTITD